MPSIGWRTLIWLLTISLSFISCQGNVCLSKWMPASDSEAVACVSEPCLPVSPARNGRFHPGCVSPQFLWEEQPVSQNSFCISSCISWSKQRITMPKLAASGQSWDTSSLPLPEGAHIPQPSCCSSSKLGEGPHVLQWQQGRHGHSCTPCLCWKVQTPIKTKGGHRASGWLAARQRQPCFSSPFSCPSGSHSLPVSWNNTEINEIG